MAANRGTPPKVPSPMRVDKVILKECAAQIDPPGKRLLRRYLNMFYKHFRGLSEMREGVQVQLKVRIPKGSRLGAYCYIGAEFYSPSPVCIGDLCMLSTKVHIVGSDHGINNPDLPTRLDFQWRHDITVIEPDVWIGHGAIIRSGVRIGTGSVVAAGSVVVKDVPPNSVFGGNPAKLIRNRFSANAWSDYMKRLNPHFIEA